MFEIFYLTPDLLIYYNQIAWIWCQSEERILSQQLSSLEVTVRHVQVVLRRFFNVFNRTMPPAHREHNTVAFLERERERREKRVVV